jgi:hypothetical protein
LGASRANPQAKSVCNDKGDVQGSGDIPDRDQILLNKGGPKEKVCRRNEQVRAQSNDMPQPTIDQGGSTKEQNTDEDAKTMRLNTGNGMRRASNRRERANAEEVADRFGDHRDTPRGDQNERIKTQRPRTQCLLWSHGPAPAPNV